MGWVPLLLSLLTPSQAGPMGWVENPALLARGTGWEVQVANLEAGMRTNGLSWDLYRRSNGMPLNEEDKQHLLDAIPGRTLRAVGTGEAALGCVRVGRHAFVSRLWTAGMVQVPKEMVELMLFGNQLGRTYQLAPRASAATFVAAGVAAGREVATLRGWRASGGVAGLVVVLMDAFRVAESSLEVHTDPAGLTIRGSTVAQHRSGPAAATPAVDLGLLLAKGPWELALAAHHLGPDLRLRRHSQTRMRSDVEGWTAADGDSGFATSDTTVQAGSWAVPLPSTLVVTLERTWWWGRACLWYGRGIHGWEGVSPGSALGVTVTWSATPWVSPWVEGATRAPEGPHLGVGARLRIGPVRASMCARGFRVPWGSSRAVGGGLSLGLEG